MLRAFIRYYQPYKYLLGLIILGSLITAALDLLFPAIVRQIINVELPHKDISVLFNYAALLLVLYCINALILYAINYHGRLMSARIENNMRRDLFNHLQRMSFNFFDNNKTGQLIARLTGDLTEIGELTFVAPNELVVCTITIFGTIFILFWMNPYLGLIISLLLIIKTIHTIWINIKMKSAYRYNRVKSGELTAKATESLSGIRLVKAFSGEAVETAGFWGKCNELLQARRVSFKLRGYFSSSVNFFTNFINLSVMLFGGLMIAHEQLAISDFIAFLLYVNLFMKPLLRLMILTEMYQRGMAGFQRFYELMSIQPDIQDCAQPVPCRDIRGAITFENLSFTYNQGRDFVIKDLNLTIQPGEKVAFVGATGAGKTTIASLLLRFYETTHGRLLIDGVDIRDYAQQELRQQIGLVQQDVFLFSESVRYNIIYGSHGYSEQELVAAAQAAAADEFIDKLPDGYDTEIGERGVKLSGGQKQRLAIARVFFKNPPIVILDEATSSLDNQTEQRVQQALEKLAQNRTTLIIAHRLSTIRNADRIVVIDEGQAREVGTHTELIRKQGLYYRLYHSSRENTQHEIQ